MKVLIVDDEPLARMRLVNMIKDIDNWEVAGEASNGREAIEMSAENPADVVLLDIRMPIMDGMEAARHLTQMERPPAIIFTTAYSDHALEAFETHAVDYLVKPIRQDRLVDALQAATRLTRAQARELAVKDTEHEARTHICARVRGNLKLVPLDDVYYFQAEQKYVTVRHKGGELLIEEPLKTLEDEFQSSFIRIHRNALVSLKYVAGMQKNSEGRHLVNFEGINDVLEISRRHVAGVRKVLKNL